MGVVTTNTIEKRHVSNISDPYLKAALANLGQRKGAKGDGIFIDEFNILNFFDTDSKPIDKINIKYINSTKTIQLFSDNSQQSTPDVEFSIGLNINSTNNNDLRFTTLESIWSSPLVYSNIYINRISENKYKCSIKASNTDKSIHFVIALNIIDEVCTDIVVFYTNTNGDVYGYASTNNQQLYKLNNVHNLEFFQDDKLYNGFIKNDIVSLDDYMLTIGSVCTDQLDEEINNYIAKCKNILPSYLLDCYVDKIWKQNTIDSLDGISKTIFGILIQSIYEYIQKSETNFTYEYYDCIISKDFRFNFLINDTTFTPYMSYPVNVLYTSIDSVDKGEIALAPDIIYAENIIGETVSERLVSFEVFVSQSDNRTRINNIYAKTLCEYPYINSSTELPYDTWFVNGVNTGVRASGVDNGDPNIMMASFLKKESSDSDKYAIDIKVLHTYKDGQTGELEKIWFDDEMNLSPVKFNYALVSNPKNIPVYEFEIKLPNANKVMRDKKYAPLFRNVFLAAFIDVSISDSIVNGMKLSDVFGSTPELRSFITVFFHITQDVNKLSYTWEPIYNPVYADKDYKNTPVLDLSAMVGLKDMIPFFVSENIEPDKYFHSWIVFDPVGADFKQSDKALNNATATYNLTLDVEPTTTYGNTYKNSTVFVPKFLPAPNIIKDGTNKITGIKSSIDDKLVTLSNIDSASKNLFNISGDYYPSYISNTTIPLLDLKELLTSHQTLIDRTGIISWSEDGKLKTLSIGTERNNTNKDIFKISANVKDNNITDISQAVDINSSNISRFKNISVDGIAVDSVFMSNGHKLFLSTDTSEAKRNDETSFLFKIYLNQNIDYGDIKGNYNFITSTVNTVESRYCKSLVNNKLIFNLGRYISANHNSLNIIVNNKDSELSCELINFNNVESRNYNNRIITIEVQCKFDDTSEKFTPIKTICTKEVIL